MFQGDWLSSFLVGLVVFFCGNISYTVWWCFKTPRPRNKLVVTFGLFIGGLVVPLCFILFYVVPIVYAIGFYAGMGVKKGWRRVHFSMVPVLDWMLLAVGSVCGTIIAIPAVIGWVMCGVYYTAIRRLRHTASKLKAKRSRQELMPHS